MSWVKISSTSFSGTTSVSIDNCFSATYTFYCLRGRITKDTSGVSLIAARLRVSGSDASTNYTRHQVQANAGTTTATLSSSQTSLTGIMGYAETTAWQYFSTYIDQPFATARTGFLMEFSYDVDADPEWYRVYGNHTDATSYTGITILPPANCSGKVIIYGLKESA